jgi:hypothetical protein
MHRQAANEAHARAQAAQIARAAAAPYTFRDVVRVNAVVNGAPCLQFASVPPAARTPTGHH